MKGKIKVVSEEGKWTEFIVKIPLELSNELEVLVDDIEIDESEFGNYEFLIFNSSQSYGI